MSYGKFQRVTRETQIIGENISHLRRRFGYSQKQIAKVLNVTFQQVQKYEKGESRISAEKLFLLQNFLGVPYGLFFSNVPVGEASDVKRFEMLVSVIKKHMDDLSDTPLSRKTLGLVLALLAEL